MEIERLKKEKEDRKDALIRKKKNLLNELCNFVNSKNNFENSFYSELTKSS